jgi:hypothetical protein
LVGSFLPAGGAGFLGGKRSACIACFTLYGLAACTVFHDDYSMLLCGRFLYGSATALLHTVTRERERRERGRWKVVEERGVTAKEREKMGREIKTNLNI